MPQRKTCEIRLVPGEDPYKLQKIDLNFFNLLSVQMQF